MVIPNWNGARWLPGCLGSLAAKTWDWQLPAVSLPAVILAGALIALSEAAPEDRADAVATSPSRHDRPHMRRRAVAT